MKQKPKSLRKLKEENKRLREIVMQYNNEAQFFVMCINQLDTTTAVLKGQDIEKFVTGLIREILERRKREGFKCWVSMFEDIHDKDGKI